MDKPDPKELFDKIEYCVIRLLLLVLLLVGAFALILHELKSIN
jgi:hypothetical protein